MREEESENKEWQFVCWRKWRPWEWQCLEVWSGLAKNRNEGYFFPVYRSQSEEVLFPLLLAYIASSAYFTYVNTRDEM